jgi:imidazole glycerol-phosphate synthase subunit HisH
MENRKKVAIIDYQLGNLFSVRQACTHLGYEAEIVSDKKILQRADYAILPGVGAFGDAKDNLAKLDLIEPMRDFIAAGKPFMGVCLGLQLLFTESEEFGNYKGLNFIEGVVRKFPPRNAANEILKVPQIEWNQIYETPLKPWKDTPLKSCRSGDYMYFVHSFYVQPATADSILSSTTYGGMTYCSSVAKDNIFACQFHPEKSGSHGVEIYRNWFN